MQITGASASGQPYIHTLILVVREKMVGNGIDGDVLSISINLYGLTTGIGGISWTLLWTDVRSRNTPFPQMLSFLMPIARVGLAACRQSQWLAACRRRRGQGHGGHYCSDGGKSLVAEPERDNTLSSWHTRIHWKLFLSQNFWCILECCIDNVTFS